MADPKLIEVFTKMFAAYNLFLVVASIVLNPIVLFICIKSKRLRSTSTFKILAVSAVNDLLACLAWNQEAFTDTYFDFQSYFRNFFYCRWISMFLQYTTVQLTSWFVVSISIDRYLSLSVKKWSTHYFTGYRPVIYSLLLVLIVAGVNFNEVFTIGYQDFVNGVEIVACFQTRPGQFNWYKLMAQVLLYFGFIVPYAIMTIFNLLIIYKATSFERAQKQTESRSSSRRKAQMTRTILLLTLWFIISSLPSTVITGYFYTTVAYNDYGPLVINFINCIQFTYPALHFFILMFTNKLFSEEAKLIVFRMQINQVSVTSKSINSKMPTRGTKDQSALPSVM